MENISLFRKIQGLCDNEPRMVQISVRTQKSPENFLLIYEGELNHEINSIFDRYIDGYVFFLAKLKVKFYYERDGKLFDDEETLYWMSGEFTFNFDSL